MVQGLDRVLTRATRKLSLVRFFDNSDESRRTHDDWNEITEEFDRYGDYSNKYTIHQIDCSNQAHQSLHCQGLPLPAIQVQIFGYKYFIF